MKLVLPVLALAASVCASDYSTEITPRFSLGVAKGFSPTQSEIDKAADAVANLVGASSAATYNVKAGVNVEVPVAIAIKGASPVYFIVAPALVYSQNKNDFSVAAGTISEDGTDKYTTMGGKVYVGIGFGGSNGFHGEVLPYIGMASIKEDFQATARNSANGKSASESDASSGTMTLYGVTFGAYYSPDPKKGFEIGARVGYAGAKYPSGGPWPSTTDHLLPFRSAYPPCVPPRWPQG